MAFKEIEAMNTTIKRLSAINYFGGKSRHMDWLLPLLDVPHTHYVEPFCGSAVVFLNKKPSPIEMISDCSGRLINFFRVLRERPDELIAMLELTLYSREEHAFAKPEAPDALEDARRFFFLSMSSFGGRVGTGREVWRCNISESRNGVSIEVSKFYNKVEGLKLIINRLRMAQIENRDAFYMMRTYCKAGTLCYLDPPYPADTRISSNDYLHELTPGQQIELLELCNDSAAHIAISTYENDLYNRYLLPDKWHKHYGPDRIVNLGKCKKREIIFTNYQPSTVQLLF